MSHGQGKPQNGQGKVREFCEGSWLDTLIWSRPISSMPFERVLFLKVAVCEVVNNKIATILIINRLMRVVIQWCWPISSWSHDCDAEFEVIWVWCWPIYSIWYERYFVLYLQGHISVMMTVCRVWCWPIYSRPCECHGDLYLWDHVSVMLTYIFKVI